MRPLQQRLSWLLLCGIAVMMVVGGGVLYPAVRGLLVAEFDYALLAKARALTTLPGAQRQGVNLSFTENPLPEFQTGPDAEYFQVWLNDGSVLARSPSLGETVLPFPTRPVNEPRFQDLACPAGVAGRAVLLGLLPDDDSRSGPSFVLLFARDRAELDRALNSLLAGLLLGGAALMAITAVLVRRTVHAGLRPVEALAAQVTRVGADSLDTRFPTTSLPDELRPIAAQLNALLDRLQAAFARERRFSANAAHELATPIAELRTLAEVSLRNPGAADVGLARDALDIAVQMQRTVESLLALTRCESGQTPLRREPVDLSRLVSEVAASCAPRAASRSLDWSASTPAEIIVESDAALLRCVVTNLLENAADHAPVQGQVRCRLERAVAEVVLTVANTNPGLTHEDLPLLFEPLWRKDAARTDHTHTGLGLALVNACVERLHGEITVELPDARTVQFVFKLPST